MPISPASNNSCWSNRKNFSLESCLMSRLGKNKPRPYRIEIREKRSLALYLAIVWRLKVNPEFWDKPLQTLDRWDRQSGPSPRTIFWREILTTKTREEIVKMLLSRSECGVTWRKSSPFTGIISQEERNKIYEKWRVIMEENTAKEQLEELRAAVREYLRHPSVDGAPVRQEKRRK